MSAVVTFLLFVSSAVLCSQTLLPGIYCLLQSPAVYALYCVFRFKEVFYDETYLAIVMEYASQGHLSSLLKRQGKLPETDARRFVGKPTCFTTLSAFSMLQASS